MDSEYIAGLLTAHGWRLARTPDRADLVIVNTCAFVREAQEESLEAVLSACLLKRAGRVGRVVAAGCLAQLEGEALARHLPDLDAIVGVNDWGRLPGLLTSDTTSGRRLFRSSPPSLPRGGPRRNLGWSHVRYVRIAEGCDAGCGFCVIPRIRGPQRSVPLGDILAEIRRVLKEGAKEIVLVAQDTTAYGRDLGRVDALPDLLLRAADVVQADGGGERWLRVLYLNPSLVSPALVRAMAQRPVLPYFDLALQHASPRVLRAMRRSAPDAGWEPLIGMIRSTLPDAILRATILLGHPGETKRDFNHLLKFIQWADLDRVGVFAYSPQPGTPSATKRRPPAAEVERRREALEQLLYDQMARHMNQILTSTLLVLIDRETPDGAALGRAWTDAPEIDWSYRLPLRVSPGTFVDAVVVGGSAGTVEVEPIPSC